MSVFFDFHWQDVYQRSQIVSDGFKSHFLARVIAPRADFL
jgi:hypothetical protein